MALEISVLESSLIMKRDDVATPTRAQFLAGVEQFERHEKRDAMYKVATFLVEHYWGNPAEMADALGVLLLTWNQAFYRYGPFSFDSLEQCLAANLASLEGFRTRDILSFSPHDEPLVKTVFTRFLDALQIDGGKMKGRKSPVAVAKALHLTAPAFLPLWDNKIARTYGCYYVDDPERRYVSFCRITQRIATVAMDYTTRRDKTLIKLIDEYNYAKFTQRWI